MIQMHDDIQSKSDFKSTINVTNESIPGCDGVDDYLLLLEVAVALEDDEAGQDADVGDAHRGAVLNLREENIIYQYNVYHDFWRITRIPQTV